MAELLQAERTLEKCTKEGFMEERNGARLWKYIPEEYGGRLDNRSDWVDNRHSLKIYGESTCDSYDIFWCTHDARPYVSQEGYCYEDSNDWSSRAIDDITSCGDVWWEPHVWSGMEFDFNYELEQWWTDVYMEYFDQMKTELLDSGDYYESKD